MLDFRKGAAGSGKASAPGAQLALFAFAPSASDTDVYAQRVGGLDQHFPILLLSFVPGIPLYQWLNVLLRAEKVKQSP